jgi:hypothetical protein
MNSRIPGPNDGYHMTSYRHVLLTVNTYFCGFVAAVPNLDMVEGVGNEKVSDEQQTFIMLKG